MPQTDHRIEFFAGFGNKVNIDITYNPSRTPDGGGTIVIKPSLTNEVNLGSLNTDSHIMMPKYWSKLVDELGVDCLSVSYATPLFEEKHRSGKMVLHRDANITIRLTPNADQNRVIERIEQAVERVHEIQASDLTHYESPLGGDGQWASP